MTGSMCWRSSNGPRCETNQKFSSNKIVCLKGTSLGECTTRRDGWTCRHSLIAMPSHVRQPYGMIFSGYACHAKLRNARPGERLVTNSLLSLSSRKWLKRVDVVDGVNVCLGKCRRFRRTSKLVLESKTQWSNIFCPNRTTREEIGQQFLFQPSAASRFVTRLAQPPKSWNPSTVTSRAHT